MTPPKPTRTVRYLVAVMMSGLAVLLTPLVRPAIIHGTFVTLCVGVLLSAWYGGVGPAA